MFLLELKLVVYTSTRVKTAMKVNFLLVPKAFFPNWMTEMKLIQLMLD